MGTLSGEATLPFSFLLPISRGQLLKKLFLEQFFFLNPTALRKAKLHRVLAILNAVGLKSNSFYGSATLKQTKVPSYFPCQKKWKNTKVYSFISMCMPRQYYESEQAGLTAQIHGLVWACAKT